MQICEHTKRIGDNYGVSCQDCGEQLEGYGYGGFLGKLLKGQRGQRAVCMCGARSAQRKNNVCIVKRYGNEYRKRIKESYG